MNDINTVTITGRLTRDAELKYTASGTALTKFAVAVNRSVKNGDTWIEAADFFDCVLWGKLGEAIAQHMSKGKRITISGRLTQNTWENKEGQKRSKVEIVAQDVILGSDGGQRTTEPKPDTSGIDTDDVAEDDIPF